MPNKNMSLVDMIQNGYNAAQVGLWSGVLILSSIYIATTGNFTILTQERTLNLLLTAQTLQVVDIIMAILKITKTSPLIATIQLFSRLVIVWIVFPAYQKNVYAPLAVYPWCFAEIIRFLNYSNDLMGWGLFFLKVLRHNAFLVLYPIGVTGEYLSIVENKTAIESYTKTHLTQKVGDIELGSIIFGFLIIYPFILWPGLAFMYYTLFKGRQRFYKSLRPTKEPVTTEIEMTEKRASSPRSKKPKRE